MTLVYIVIITVFTIAGFISRNRVRAAATVAGTTPLPDAWLNVIVGLAIGVFVAGGVAFFVGADRGPIINIPNPFEVSPEIQELRDRQDKAREEEADAKARLKNARQRIEEVHALQTAEAKAAEAEAAAKKAEQAAAETEAEATAVAQPTATPPPAFTPVPVATATPPP